MAVLTYSAVAVGLKVIPVVIEAALGQGFSGLQIIGLPAEYCRDARERIRASVEAVGISIPARRLIVSVRPSETLKQFKCGLEHLDLACAVAVVAALAEQSTPPKNKHFHLTRIRQSLKNFECFFAGQLTLTGEVLKQDNSLPFEIVSMQKNTSLRAFFSSSEWSGEKEDCSNWHVVSELFACLRLLNTFVPDNPNTLNSLFAENFKSRTRSSDERNECWNIDAVKQTLLQLSLQPALALAVFLSAAGRHHLLIAGSPGSGKTFALKAMQKLLPPLTHQERIDIALIHSRNPYEISERPFRSPHHSASGAALLGGSLLQPGEVTLAHHGVLFLDELTEFQRPTLEALREPLDGLHISLSRARGRAELPAHFLLLAATNPCPCGYFFSVSKPCRCQASAPFRYQQKLSGPLLERFSILLLVDALAPEASNEVFPEAQRLSLFAQTWFDSFLAQPEHWCKKLRSAQARFWTANDVNLNTNAHSAIEHHSQGKMWSMRKKAQITRLCQTINFLFDKEIDCSLSINEAVALAADLRGLEQCLFESVHLLTPQRDNPQLKKSTSFSDTHF